MTFKVILIQIKYLRIYNISIHINFYQNRFINESVRKNFLKFSERRVRRKDMEFQLTANSIINPLQFRDFNTIIHIGVLKGGWDLLLFSSFLLQSSTNKDKSCPYERKLRL